jgi:hypothetical protein
MSTVGQSYNVTYTCGSDNGYDGRLGVRISSIFVIGFGSMLGTFTASLEVRDPQKYPLIHSHRCADANCRSENKAYACSALGLLHNEVFWIRGHHSHCFYTCK